MYFRLEFPEGIVEISEEVDTASVVCPDLWPGTEQIISPVTWQHAGTRDLNGLSTYILYAKACRKRLSRAIPSLGVVPLPN